MKQPVIVVFASCSGALEPALIAKAKALAPDLPLLVVSEFPPAEGRWIPYHVRRSFADNFARCRAALAGKQVKYALLVLEPQVPYRRMRLIALLLAPWRLLLFNEHFDHFMLRPRCAGAVLRHFTWRSKNLLRWQLNPGGHVYTWFWRLRHPRELRRPLRYAAALAAGVMTAGMKWVRPAGSLSANPEQLPSGVTVVIPSRNGRELLERLFPGLERELAALPHQIVIVDNGSNDGTAEAFRERATIVSSAEPLSFARAINRGLALAKYSRVLLLNNDMTLEPGFFMPLLQSFHAVPDLFCAAPEILFPEGERRQETGKAVIDPSITIRDFPVRCVDPIPGEDHTYVLYGSGGCSLYDTAKLRMLGGMRELLAPAYVEDLDIGYRAWQQGWPSVFVAGARIVHRHRATTSRYFSERELGRMVEVNYLRFLAASVSSPSLFYSMWRRALRRLNLLAVSQAPVDAAGDALAEAWQAPLWSGRAATVLPERLILAAGSSELAVFPGRPRSGRPVVLIASPYLPFPLAHGGAVRMFNLTRRAAADYDQVLVCFAPELAAPAPELLEVFTEVVLVRHSGSHLRTRGLRPDVVEDFDSPAFHAALALTARKWKPAIAQLEFTQMAQYATDCGSARTVLVEHDVTLDLYAQLLSIDEAWDTRQQFERWQVFERDAWRRVDRVVLMSEKDAAQVGRSAVVIPNGVDLDRFRPAHREPEARRILFIGSFGHLPNLLALDFFAKQVWPHLADLNPALHVIAGNRPEYFRELYRDRVQIDLEQPGIELEGFVADVRGAYSRAALVIAPLLASAGTNIKIMEAMAMGRAIVSTPAGINGLDLDERDGVLVADTAEEFALMVRKVLTNSELRSDLEQRARASAERKYDWDAIAATQRTMYEDLLDARAGGPAF